MQTIINITIFSLLIGYLFLLKYIFELLDMLTEEAEFYGEMINSICKVLTRHINDEHKKEAENEVST